MAGTNFSLQICNNITNDGIVGLTVILYHYGVTISSGTVTGTKATDSEGSNLVATEVGGGVYNFTDVPSGKYTVVLGSENIVSQILSGYEGFDIVSVETINEIISFIRAEHSESEGLPDLVPSGA